MIILITILQGILRILFFLPVNIALAIMNFFAVLTYYIARITPFRKNAENNIKLVLPHADLRSIADKLLKNTSYSIFEVLCLPFFKKGHFHRTVRWQGIENLEKALGNGKGAIILTIHAGNYEIISPALAHLGYKMNIIQKTTDDPIFQIVNRSRSASGSKMINVLEQDMYKETFKILKRNEVIGHLADTGALESRHISVKFLGKEVPVATGWLTLAQRAKCPVIPTLCKRDGKINHITLHEPTIVTKDNREEVMRKILKIFEDYVRQNPQDWLIFLNSYETERMRGLRD